MVCARSPVCMFSGVFHKDELKLLRRAFESAQQHPRNVVPSDAMLVMLQNEPNLARFFRTCETRRHVDHPRRNVLARAFRTLRPSSTATDGGAQSSTGRELSWPEFLGLMQCALVSSTPGGMARTSAAQRNRGSNAASRKPRRNIAAQYHAGQSNQVKLVRRSCAPALAFHTHASLARCVLFADTRLVCTKRITGARKLVGWSPPACAVGVPAHTGCCAGQLSCSRGKSRRGGNDPSERA